MDLDEAAVGRLLHVEDVIPAMERALADFSSGKVVQPLRQIVPVAEHGGHYVEGVSQPVKWVVETTEGVTCPECGSRAVPV